MTDVLIAGSTWLHLLSTIILLGFYALTALIYVPVIRQQMADPAAGQLILHVMRRARLYIGLALLIFMITGTYMMIANDQYTGMGEIQGTWAVMLVIKHVVIFAMIGLAVFIQRGPLRRMAEGESGALASFQRMQQIMLALGAVVLLLTAIAEVG